MTKDKQDNKLLQCSKDYSEDVVAFCRVLRTRKTEADLVRQLLRAGTSVGANIAEAQRAQGRKDFVSKLEIAEKECDESAYWFELLYHAGNLSFDEYKHFRNQWISIQRLIAASCNTVKRNMESERMTERKEE